MKKKILFVINTLGHAGAEVALMELLRNLSPEQYEVSLLVLLGQGDMVKELLWRVAAVGAPRIREHFDLAVAYLEGGSAYYVADYIDADRKAAFIHIDYNLAGYNRELDQDCYLKYDRIFGVSGMRGPD